jgi:hypothetical protein
MSHRKSIAERVDGFRRYYQRLNERPLLGFFCGSEYPLFRYRAAVALPTDRPLRPEDFDAAAYAADAARLFEEHENCGGDFIWAGSAFWGIPWVEAVIGCSLYADQSTGSISSRKPTDLRGPDGVPDFDPCHPWIAKLGEMLDCLAETSLGQWPISTTRMRGISDLLTALYGSAEFIFAMMERPEEVQNTCRRLTDLWIQIGQFQLERIPLFRNGVGSYGYNMWAPPGTIWHQEDAVAMLSPRLFDEFIRPCDQRIVGAFEHCIIHTHPSGFLPMDAYLGMDFTAIELHIDQGGPTVQELWNQHRQILEKKPLLIWGRLGEDELDWVFSRLPPQGLAVMSIVADVEQAQTLRRHLEDHSVRDST